MEKKIRHDRTYYYREKLNLSPVLIQIITPRKIFYCLTFKSKKKMNALTVAELAMHYFPNASKITARRNLLKMIHKNKKLEESLKMTHFKKGERFLTPIQIQMIYDELGEP